MGIVSRAGPDRADGSYPWRFGTVAPDYDSEITLEKSDRVATITISHPARPNPL